MADKNYSLGNYIKLTPLTALNPSDFVNLQTTEPSFGIPFLTQKLGGYTVGADSVYIGFLASTGAGYESHWLYDFSYTNGTQTVTLNDLINNSTTSSAGTSAGNVIGGAIRLTTDLYASVICDIQYNNPIKVIDNSGNLLDFSMYWKIFVGGRGGVGSADGLGFFMHTDVGTGGGGFEGGYLGLKNFTNGIGIIWDTWKNEWDPNNNHIEIDVNGDVINSLVTVTPSFSAWNGVAVDPITRGPVNPADQTNYRHVWVDYISGAFKIYASTDSTKPATALLTYPLDIRQYLFNTSRIPSPNKPYYFPVIGNDSSYSNSRKFTGDDSLVLKNNNLGINNPNPVYDLDINGNLNSTFGNLSPNISTNNLFVQNVNNFNNVQINSKSNLNNNSYFNNIKSNSIVVTSLTSVSTLNIIFPSNALRTITITNSGYGYESVPAVVITGGGPPFVNATAIANLDTRYGSISSITITNSGIGYTFNPTITLSSYQTSSLGVTSLGVKDISNNYLYTGFINLPKVIVTKGGEYYSLSAIPAIGDLTSTTLSSTITSINILNTGYGYQNNLTPVIKLSANSAYVTGIGSITLGVSGYGYESVPNVIITGGGNNIYSNAIASANLNTTNGSISSITINNRGIGYTSNPTINVQTTQTSTLGITSINILNGSNYLYSGFTRTPVVSVYKGLEFDSANATAVLGSPISTTLSSTITSINITDTGYGYIFNTTPSIKLSANIIQNVPNSAINFGNVFLPVSNPTVLLQNYLSSNVVYQIPSSNINFGNVFVTASALGSISSVNLNNTLDSLFVSDLSTNNVLSRNNTIAYNSYSNTLNTISLSTNNFTIQNNLVNNSISNLLYSSEYFGYWDDHYGCSVIDNYTTAPNGTNTAAYLYEIATTPPTSNPVLEQSVDVYPDTNRLFTFSVYVSAAGETYMRLNFYDYDNLNLPNGGPGLLGAEFNIKNGTIRTPAYAQNCSNVGLAASITPYNGWYRCSITGNCKTTAGNPVVGNTLRLRIYLSGYNGQVSNTANGGLYVWGAQLEQNSAPSPYIKVEKNISSSGLLGNKVYGKIDIDPFYFSYNNKNQLSVGYDNDLYLGIKPSDPYSTEDVTIQRTKDGPCGIDVANHTYILKPYFKNLQGAVNYADRSNLRGNNLNLIVFENIVEGEDTLRAASPNASGVYCNQTTSGNLKGGYYSTEWLGTTYPELTTAGILGGHFFWSKNNTEVPWGNIYHVSINNNNFKNTTVQGYHEIGTRITTKPVVPSKIDGNNQFTLVYPVYCVVPSAGNYTFNLNPSPNYASAGVDDHLYTYVDGSLASINTVRDTVTQSIYLTGSHMMFLVHNNGGVTAANLAFKPIQAGVNLYGVVEAQSYVNQNISNISLPPYKSGYFQGLYYTDSYNRQYFSQITSTNIIPSPNAIVKAASAINFSVNIGNSTFPALTDINRKIWDGGKPFDQASPIISIRTHICANSALTFGNFGTTSGERVYNFSTTLAKDPKTWNRPFNLGATKSNFNMFNMCLEFANNCADNTCIWLQSPPTTAFSNVTLKLTGPGRFYYSPILTQQKNGFIRVSGSLQYDPFNLSPWQWNKNLWTSILGASNAAYYPGYGLAIVGNNGQTAFEQNPTISENALVFFTSQETQTIKIIDEGQTARPIGNSSPINSSIIFDGNFNSSNMFLLQGGCYMAVDNQIYKTNNFGLSSYVTKIDPNTQVLSLNQSYKNDFLPFYLQLGSASYNNIYWRYAALISWDVIYNTPHLINRGYNGLLASNNNNYTFRFDVAKKTWNFSEFTNPYRNISGDGVNNYKLNNSVGYDNNQMNYVTIDELLPYNTQGLYTQTSPLCSTNTSTMVFWTPPSR